MTVKNFTPHKVVVKVSDGRIISYPSIEEIRVNSKQSFFRNFI